MTKLETQNVKKKTQKVKMWHDSKPQNVTKLQNFHCGKSKKTKNVTQQKTQNLKKKKLKNSKCIKLKNSKCDKTKKLQRWQN